MSGSLSMTLFYVAAAINEPAAVAAISCFSCANSDLNSMNERDDAVYRSKPLAFHNHCRSKPEMLLNGWIDCPNGRCFTFLQAATNENYPEKVIRGCSERQFHNVDGLLRFARDPANRQSLSLNKWHECSTAANRPKATRTRSASATTHTTAMQQQLLDLDCFAADDCRPNRSPAHAVPPRLPLVVLLLLSFI